MHPAPTAIRQTMTCHSPPASSSASATAACIVASVIACAGGCRSAAHDDIYTDKLASEVRFLEDQLYQVDYENKVLRQKVERLRSTRSDSSKPRRESLLGLPSLSVPCGFTESGLPVGLQITGRHHQDFAVLQLGHAYEQATGHWKRRPL